METQFREEFSPENRRGKDRRKRQIEAGSAWDGIERRSKKDRRKAERLARAEQDPIYIAKMNKLQERREKERKLEEKRKKGREKKEVFRPK